MGIDNAGTDRFQQKLERRQRKLTPLRILVVDDEPSILELLQTALVTLEGYDVTTAGSAARALEAIETIAAADAAFDCILLDIQMPERNGIELLREIRKMPDYADTPIIMLTAMYEREYVDKAFLNGATDYVTKPFDFLELRSRMRSVQILVTEQARTRRSQESVRALEEELNLKSRHNFEDPFAIADVARLLGYVEFDNYVAQLSHGRLFNSCCVAVKLQDAASIHETAARGGFRQVIEDLARAISTATFENDCIFSYRGRGVFLVVEHRPRAAATSLQEGNLKGIFGALLEQRRSSTLHRALIGDPVSLRSLSRARAFTALRTAIDSVEKREREMLEQKELELVGDGPLSRIEGKQIRQRIYEKVLVELFREESYLGKR